MTLSSHSPPLAIRGLCKRYGSLLVLDALDFVVGAGETLALHGRNGAGKSTLIGCTCGTVIPDAGSIAIAGHELHAQPIAARRALRYLPQEVELPAGLTGREILEFYGGVFSDPDQLSGAIDLAAIGPAIDHLASTYSVGMRRRLAFAGLSFGEASLYVLDEPFAGIDGESRERLQAWLTRASARGAALLIAAHDQENELLDALSARTLDLSLVDVPLPGVAEPE